jgi:hypothetical protein
VLAPGTVHVMIATFATAIDALVPLQGLVRGLTLHTQPLHVQFTWSAVRSSSYSCFKADIVVVLMRLG